MDTRGFISHLDLNVSDPEESIRFYAVVLGHLGFERHDINDGRAWWSLGYADGSSLGIEVRPPRSVASSTARAVQPGHRPSRVFHAESRHDVDELHAKLIDWGYAVADPPAEYDYTPGYYAIAFDDPSGIRLEVVHDPSTNP